MKKTLALIAVMALAFSVTPAIAQVPSPITVEDEPDLQSYGAATMDKLSRGTANVLFGWTQPIQDLRNDDGSRNKSQVFLEGLGNGVVRTFVGLGQIAMAPIPSVDWEGDAGWAIE